MARAGVLLKGRHRVQFYEDAAYLAERIGAFVRGALDQGGIAIMVARQSTTAAVHDELRASRIEVDALIAGGRIIEHDASETLALFCTGALPDRGLFREHVATVVTKARAAFPDAPLHIYGEMVDVLCDADKPEAALALEGLWNELATTTTFSLLCGYRIGAFGDQRHVGHFETVCAHHDEVAPTEQVAGLTREPEAALALALLEQRARLAESEVARRRAMGKQIDQLFIVAGELASATSREVIARITVEKAIAAVGAASGGLWLVDGDVMSLAGVAERHAADKARFSSIPLGAETPLGHAVRTGEHLFLRPSDYRTRFPGSYERIRDLVPWDRAMFAALPLVTSGRPFGGITFTYADIEDTHENRMFLEILARQCALALERALLLEAERSGRADAELLYELTAEVNRTEDLGRIYELALIAVERGARCDRSAILLCDQDGVMRFKSSRGLSEKYRRAVEGHSPWQVDQPDPEPVIVDDVLADPAWAKYRDVFVAEGLGAIAFVPLLHQRKLLGKFMLYRNRARAFTARDIQLAATVAVHVTQALERTRAEQRVARAYEDERRARFEAEEATRAREEILSVVSHDLRNPLGTILMGASTLGNFDCGEKTERVHTTARRIERQAQRMARLIEDLVDFSGIQAGRLKIEPRRHLPRDILAAASEIFAPVASERGLRLETSADADLPHVVCDSDRAVQVLSNLLANAIKVTPSGGAIAIGAHNRDDDIVFFVRDSGPGIDPEELPNLFERYWRSKKPYYKGAGLGLSIARGIVDAHGGKIWAESELGSGSTFYFSLSFGGARRN